MEKLIIANVVRVDMITEEATPTAITVDTGSEVGVEPNVNEGSKTPLRVKNVILAQNNYEDLVIGYALTLKDLALRFDQLALVDGGTATSVGTGDAALLRYQGPQTGLVLTRKKVTLDIWSEEKDADGDTLSYVRFRVQHAKGKPVSFSLQDGQFFAPEYKMDSSPKIGEAPMDIQQFNALPSSELTAQELLELTNAV